MEIFDNTLAELKTYLKEKSEKATVFQCNEKVNWEKDEKTNIIMENDSAIELGHRTKESVYFLAWSEKNEHITDGKITVIGKDIPAIKEGKCSFGELILIKGHGFTEENAFDRHLELDLVKRRMNLKGYMIRAVPQRMREWSRISKDAVKKGFSFETLGSELIKKYKEIEYVDEVEVIFITSNDEDIKELVPVGTKVTKSVEAMNKMFENLQYDCKSCEFEDVCDEFGELKQMHKKMQK